MPVNVGYGVESCGIGSECEAGVELSLIAVVENILDATLRYAALGTSGAKVRLTGIFDVRQRSSVNCL